MVTQDAKYQAGNKTIISAYVNAPFDVAKAELEGKGYAIITPEQFAQLRIAKEADHKVSTNGAYTSMGDVMIPKKGRFLTNLSPVMKNSVEATNAHRSGKEFYVSGEDAEKALAGGNVVVPYNQSEVPTDRFGEDPITAFVFGKTAKAYGEFLKKTGINAMPLWFNDEKYINSQEKPFANQLWLRRLDADNQSNLYGDGRNLNCGNAVRGVRNVEPRSGETASKISGYKFTNKQAEKYLKILKEVRTGNIPASKLEEVIKAFSA